jgi:hypothetical protein
VIEARHGVRERAPAIVKAVGLGVSGALNATAISAYLVYAGASFVVPLNTTLALVIYGSLGGFMGVEVGPLLAAPRRKRAGAIDLLSSAGTLVANSAALAALWVIFTETRSHIAWTVLVGFCWVFGVTLQIAAGILARLHAVDSGIA